MPIRKSLSHRTIFNILGPLTNPAGVKKQLIGVFSDAYIHRISTALELLGTQNSLVVSSKDGMDEISICDLTYATLLKEGRSEDIMIDPAELGLSMAPKEAIIGGDAHANASITSGILKGHIQDAKRDIVLINAAAALVVDAKARDFQEGLEIAREVIDSGRAKTHLELIIKLSKQLS
jgi:anthranilate phosphoribosyltransferase